VAVLSAGAGMGPQIWAGEIFADKSNAADQVKGLVAKGLTKQATRRSSKILQNKA